MTATTGEGYTLKIGSYDELSRFRDKVNNGVSYAGATVELTADIDISSRAWTPIGANARKHPDDNKLLGTRDDDHVFRGTFDGKDHTISGLNNTGFSLNRTFGDANNSTPPGCKEFVFGFFGSTYNATIKNLKMSNVNIDLAYQLMGKDDTGYYLGDSTGAIIGCLIGDNSVVEGCHVTSGTINGYDAVGGLIGRVASGNITVRNCSNAATVTAVRRVGGIVGVDAASSNVTRVYEGLKNTGDVVSLGNKADIPGIETEDVNAINQNYFLAGGIMTIVNDYSGFEKNLTLTNCENTGKVEAKNVEVIDGRQVVAQTEDFEAANSIARGHTYMYKNNEWVSNPTKTK